MRLFALVNFEHMMVYIFPTIVFMMIFGLALGYTHFRGADDERRKTGIHGRYPDDLADRDAPFPLCLTLTIVGTLLWGFFYILFYGLLDARI